MKPPLRRQLITALLPLFVIAASTRAAPERRHAHLGAPAQAKRPRSVAVDSDNVPVFARLLGVRAGIDTVERVEKLYGPWFTYIGGHPRGGREWRVRNSNVYIDMDGFYYRNHRPYGRVIDSVSVTERPLFGGPEIPTTSVEQGRLRFMGVVSLGMSRAQTLRLLADRLPPPKVGDNGATFEWSATGYVRVNSVRDEDMRGWLASLHFENDRLVTIGLGAGNE